MSRLAVRSHRLVLRDDCRVLRAMSFACASTSVWNRCGLGTGRPLRYRVLPGWRVGYVAAMRWRRRAGIRTMSIGGRLRHGNAALPGTRVPACPARSTLH